MPPVIAVRTALYRTGRHPAWGVGAAHAPDGGEHIRRRGQRTWSVGLGSQGVLPKRARGQTKRGRGPTPPQARQGCGEAVAFRAIYREPPCRHGQAGSPHGWWWVW